MHVCVCVCMCVHVCVCVCVCVRVRVHVVGAQLEGTQSLTTLIGEGLPNAKNLPDPCSVGHNHTNIYSKYMQPYTYIPFVYDHFGN